MLLQAKKVHLREDFEPWIPLDLMENEDKKAVFRKVICVQCMKLRL